MISPLVGFYFMFNFERSIHLSYLMSVILYFGTLAVLILVSIVVYLCVEYPLKKVLRITILDWLSSKIVQNNVTEIDDNISNIGKPYL